MQPATLKRLFKGKVVILGIGNILRGDDGLGPALIARLQGEVKAVCLDTGTAPENYLGKIAKEKPDTVLIVDALYLGKRPGEYQILKKDDILSSGLTTHDISPQMLIEYLQKKTRADIYLLGMQPKNVSFGQNLSDEVKASLDQLADMIRGTLPCTKPI
jgi:hydrogenase 3 maturation protease